MTNSNEQRTGMTDRQERLGRLAYSVTEAAAVTGLGRTTLYALMGSGELPSCKIGKRRLIASADLESMIGQARQAAARRPPSLEPPGPRPGQNLPLGFAQYVPDRVDAST